MATLGSEYYFEPLRPSRRRYDILFQQLLMEILGRSGISADSFFNKIKAAYPFSQINRNDFDRLLKHWINADLIMNDGRVLIIGPVIEKKFSPKNFMELYSVFDVNEYHTVYFNEEEIGYLESWFACSLKPEESVFQLAGRKWAVIELIGDLKRIYVKPAKDALPPVWRGGGNYHIEYEVARRFQDILAGTYDLTNKITSDALETFQLYRKSLGHSPVAEGKIGIAKIGKEIWIETYAGSMINTVLSFALTDAFPWINISHNFFRLEFELNKHSLGEIIQSLYDFILHLPSMDYRSWTEFLSRHIVDLKYSRFSDFVPVEFSVHHAAEAYFVLNDLQKFASNFNQESVIMENWQ